MTTDVPIMHAAFLKRDIMRAVKDVGAARQMFDGGRVEIFADEHLCAHLCGLFGAPDIAKDAPEGMKYIVATSGKWEIAFVWGHQLNVLSSQRKRDGQPPMASLIDWTDVKTDGTRGDLKRHLCLIFDR